METSATHLEHRESKLDHLESKGRLKIQKIIKEFSTVLTPKLGLTNLIEYKINLNDNIVIRLHPVSYTHLDSGSTRSLIS